MKRCSCHVVPNGSGWAIVVREPDGHPFESKMQAFDLAVECARLLREKGTCVLVHVHHGRAQGNLAPPQPQ